MSSAFMEPFCLSSCLFPITQDAARVVRGFGAALEPGSQKNSESRLDRSRRLSNEDPAASYSPMRRPHSTIGAGGLNFRVRDGNGCDPSALATGNRCTIALGNQAE